LSRRAHFAAARLVVGAAAVAAGIGAALLGPERSYAQAQRDAAGKGGGQATATPQRQRQLTTALSAADASQSVAADALADSEAAISAANRRVRELAQARRQVERQIAVLAERSRTAATRQTEQERQLGLVLRAQFALAQAQPWQRLVDGDDPNQIGRDLHYLDYVARAKAALIGELTERQTELAALRDESRAKQAELAAIAADEQANRRQLLQQQAARKQALDRLSRQIASQRQSISSLERDERRMSSLIEEINKVLAEQARREAQQRAARRSAPAAVPGGRAPAGDDVEPPAGTQFARLRGKLLLPVKGEITARFGAARRTEAGVDAPTWKGVFIRAAEGADVHAVAAGRVVFADWLRGFGNLLIVDHGDAFLSVYGNNETLLAQVGERIGAGDVIAQVGNTGGSPQPGLYFELRLEGRPVDPLRWASAR
jgi:septal ring factor EnvC (AmiA/AmiB activator)